MIFFNEYKTNFNPNEKTIVHEREKLVNLTTDFVLEPN